MLAYPLARVKSPWGVWMRVSQFAVAPMAILLLFAGTAYAAQGALPGDLLYPVKIHVNESVEVALATTPQEQVAVQTQLAAERVAEAQALATAGKLDATTTQELQDNFDAHASEAIAIAEQTADVNASSTLTFATSTASSTDTSLVVATTTASTTPLPDAANTAEVDIQAVDSLKTSLDNQSNIFKMLRLHMKVTRDADEGTTTASTTDAEASSTESSATSTLPWHEREPLHRRPEDEASSSVSL